MIKVILSALVFSFIPGMASASKLFSLDPASPSIDGNITPDDVLDAGPVVSTPGTSLGLVDGFFSGFFDNLNALSNGRDPIGAGGPLFFSVDRVAVGVPGSDVNSEAMPGVEEAHGDIFQALPPANNNIQFVDEQTLGLIPGFFGDDLDALELDSTPTRFTYFSVDDLSFPSGAFSGDILISDGTNTFNVFANGVSDIGLDGFDDIDALALLDRGTVGVLDPGIDMALFSISTFSPNATTSGGAFSPGDVLQTNFTGSFSVFATAAQLGLRSDDELNALDTTAPEPSTLALFGLGLAGLGAATARRRR